MNQVKNAIDESLDYDYNKICFSEDEITMNNYFAKISDICVREEGLYLVDYHLYQ